jgi:hypothetical protein
MDKQLGSEYPEGERRQSFLKDNCDSVELKGYMKPYTPEQLQQMKESLAETSISINDVEEQKKNILKDFKAQTEPLFTEKSNLLKGIKQKAEFVDEECYKFVDTATKEVGFYNSEGNLIESRPAYGNELQGTIFQIQRTGTDHK